MFNRKEKVEAPQRRLVLCASCSEQMLRNLLLQINIEVAEALAVQTQAQLLEIIEKRTGEIDDLILCTDFADERSLEKLVREIPQSIIIFLIRNKSINSHILSKIHAEGVEQIEAEDVAGLYGKQTDEIEEAEQSSKPAFMTRLKKPLTKAAKKDFTQKAAQNKATAEKLEDDLTQKGPGTPEKKPKKSKKKWSLPSRRENEDRNREDDKDKGRGLAIKKIELGRITKGRTETDQGPRVREIKTVEQKVVYTKQVRTKIRRSSTKKYRIAVTGMAQSGKSTFALALTHEIARRKEKAALVDLDYESKAPLSKLLGASDTEDGLIKLLDDQTDPLSIDKTYQAGLYTSSEGQFFESVDIMQMLSVLEESREHSVVDIPVSALDALHHYDRLVFIFDCDPVRAGHQLEVLLDVMALKCAPLTVILNKHTKSCLDRRAFRKRLNGLVKSYFNDIYVCPFDVADFDYMRSHVHGGFDGSKFKSPVKAAESIVNSLFV